MKLENLKMVKPSINYSHRKNAEICSYSFFNYTSFLFFCKGNVNKFREKKFK